jgi:Integrase core domain
VAQPIPDTLNALNQQGLTAEYAELLSGFARSGVLEQEYITPYRPEQNGMIERFFLTLKQECVWLQRFDDRDHAFRVVADCSSYHTERPHSALGYLTPKWTWRLSPPPNRWTLVTMPVSPPASPARLA